MVLGLGSVDLGRSRRGVHGLLVWDDRLCMTQCVRANTNAKIMCSPVR